MEAYVAGGADCTGARLTRPFSAAFLPPTTRPGEVTRLITSVRKTFRPAIDFAVTFRRGTAFVNSHRRRWRDFTRHAPLDLDVRHPHAPKALMSDSAQQRCVARRWPGIFRPG